MQLMSLTTNRCSSHHGNAMFRCIHAVRPALALTQRLQPRHQLSSSVVPPHCNASSNSAASGTIPAGCGLCYCSASDSTSSDSTTCTSSTPTDGMLQWWPAYVESMLSKTKPNAITVLGLDMVVWYDKETGRWQAWQDKCPHRLAPLSEGRLQGNTIICNLHGWEFNSCGICTRIPQQGSTHQTPSLTTATAARRQVASYPTCLAQGLLWVWPDASAAAVKAAAASQPAAVVPELDVAMSCEVSTLKQLRKVLAGVSHVVARRARTAMQQLIQWRGRADAQAAAAGSGGGCSGAAAAAAAAAGGAHASVPWCCAGQAEWFMREVPVSAATLTENVLDPAHIPFAHHGVLADRHGEQGLSVRQEAGGRIGPSGFALRVEPHGQPSSLMRFVAPCLIVYDFDQRPMSKRTLFATHHVPIRPGWTRIFIRVIHTKGRGLLIAVQLALQRALPALEHGWVRNEVLDGDVYMLHLQERKLLAASGPEAWRTAYQWTGTSDLGVSVWRTWLQRFGAGMPLHPHRLDDLPAQMAKQQVLDRYSQHVLHCRHCQQALFCIERIVMPGLALMAMGCMLCACGMHGREAAAAGRMLLVLCGMGLHVLANWRQKFC